MLCYDFIYFIVFMVNNFYHEAHEAYEVRDINEDVQVSRMGSVRHIAARVGFEK